ncbi:hypothetical protein JOE29_003454 [Pseudomonas sp. PvP009]|uniref:JmjC domain-containing protein n=1 Tax=Pseudomonas sp. PvP009 TaxID=2806584 RepID=UPI001AE3007E|nr:cupin domain-containing protein [Pseudomonas sp. PvP009]MBP1141503.1 hypothetical protein [Pseudomonas sp. PvP009]
MMDKETPIVVINRAEWSIPCISIDWLKLILQRDWDLRDFLVIKKGSTCKESVYIRPCKKEMLSLIDRLYLAEGCTLYLRKIENYDPSFFKFKTELEKEFPNCAIQLNAFFTPPWSCALTAHADDHDLLAIQIAGKKKWSFWRPLYEVACKGLDAHQISVLSMEHAGNFSEEQEHVLEAGSYFFMGKGTIHKAQCFDEPSIHVSVWLEYD